MKKHLPLLIFTLFIYSPTVQAQTCGVIHQDIVLNSQAQVDAFPASFPGCTRLLGGLRVEGSNITNVDGLINIQTVDQSIWIVNNPLLSNLSGFANLTTAY